MLLLIHDRDTNNNKQQENSKFSNRRCHTQEIKYVQRKNVNMTWYYKKFPRHPVTAENFKMRVRNTILLHYHYRVDPEVGKSVCAIHRVPFACTACVAQLDKYLLPNIAKSPQPRYARVETFYYNKILEHYNYWIIMEFLENKTPQVDFYNIHALIISVISNNKVEPVEVNGCRAIYANDEAANYFYIVFLTYVPYTLQEDC